MSRYIADENFPFQSFAFLIGKGIEVIHVGTDFPSISDESVIELAREEGRLLLTLDRDHGELVFTGAVVPPPGIIYFRLPQYRPIYLGEVLLKLIAAGEKFEGFFTVITPRGTRRRPI